MKNIIKKWWFWITIACVILVVVLGMMKFKEQKQLEDTYKTIGESASDFYTGIEKADTHLDEFTYNYETGEVEYKPQADNTWLEKYNSIEKGMTSSEVIQILGEGFITPGIDDTEYFMNWGVNEGLIEGQIITIQFNNEKVHLKTQIGLK